MQRQLESERDRGGLEKKAEEDRAREAEERVREAEERVRESEERVREEGERVRVVEVEARMEKDAAEERVRVVEGERDVVMVELCQARARNNELQQRLGEVEGREQEKLVVQEQAIAAEQRGPSWEVREDELEILGEELGLTKMKVPAKVLKKSEVGGSRIAKTVTPQSKIIQNL